jgi:hypothetical protein
MDASFIVLNTKGALKAEGISGERLRVGLSLEKANLTQPHPLYGSRWAKLLYQEIFWFLIE